MRRREFLTLLGGAAAAWPLAARAQQIERIRRVGLLSVGTEDISAIDAFREALAKLGWVEGRNLHVELRFSGDSEVETRRYAADLLALAPDVMVTRGGFPTRLLQQLTRTIPIVTAGAGDLIASGTVKDIAHPEGNVTGVTNRVDSIEGKLLALLKEAAPGMRRIAALYPSTIDSSRFVREIDRAAQALALLPVHISYRTAVDIVRGIDAFAAEGGGGLMVSPAALTTSANRQVFLQLAAQYRLPTVSQFREFAAEGWLISYGTDAMEISRRAAFYVDRLLRGAKVSELPVEFPSKFELVINLKTAKALGLTMPITVLAHADDVIE
jgi:putative tryptophan/tyrosine transport system substrate-binding protein